MSRTTPVCEYLHAASVAAEVVELRALRDGADVQLVGDSMCVGGYPLAPDTPTELAVSGVAVAACRPLPARSELGSLFRDRSVAVDLLFKPRTDRPRLRHVDLLYRSAMPRGRSQRPPGSFVDRRF